MSPSLELAGEVERESSAMVSPNPAPASPTWKSFLRNHVEDLVSIDFFGRCWLK